MFGVIKSVKEEIGRFVREYYRFIFAGVLIGTLTYLLLMAGELVNNYDGIWHPSNFVAGNWEIALGRPFERYLDRARFGVVSSVLNSCMVFIFIAAADALILDRFENKDRFSAFLFLLLTIACPITGELLSYYYLAVNYECAFFLSVLAFAVIPDKPAKGAALWGRAALGGLILAFSMSFYQAYIGVTCVLFVSFVMKLLKEDAKKEQLLRYAGAAFLSIAFGGIFYLGIVKVMLLRAGTALASYKGADSVSLPAIVMGFPASIVNCYRQFIDFVFINRFDTRLEFSAVMAILAAVCALLSVAFETWRLFKRNKSGACIFAALVLIMPVAACAVVIIAVGNTVTGLMAMGILIGFLMILLLSEHGGPNRKIYTVALCVAAWFMLHQVQNDQVAMKEGMNATRVLTEDVIGDLFENGYPTAADTVAFVGRAAENPRFVQSGAFGIANEYAQFGKWSTDPRNNRATWYGITTKLCGTFINLCSDDIYAELIDSDRVAGMPVYPEKGSIAVIDGIMVVKVSDLYR